MVLSKQEIELFLPVPVIRSKNFFNKSIPICFNDSKMVYGTGNGIILTGNGIISPLSSHQIKKII
jgi:hypothetical protein